MTNSLNLRDAGATVESASVIRVPVETVERALYRQDEVRSVETYTPYDGYMDAVEFKVEAVEEISTFSFNMAVRLQRLGLYIEYVDCAGEHDSETLYCRRLCDLLDAQENQGLLDLYRD